MLGTTIISWFSSTSTIYICTYYWFNVPRFEDELRLVDPSVTLPYWDSTMDYNMDNSINSITWSLNFFGNGNGEVNTGPFSG